jgi:mono/diheme cytochrome c family protein
MPNPDFIRICAGAVLGALFALPAAAQDPGRGQELYELHCLTCHYERIHKRDPSRSTVRSYTQLRVEVANRAALVVKQQFSTQDLDAIAEYLNRSHYKFER